MTEKHKQEAREMVEDVFGKRGSNPIYATAGRLFDEIQANFAAALSSRDTETQRAVDTLVTAHNSTMDARDKEIREVLEGLRDNGGCWCRDGNPGILDHSLACLAARVLWRKVQEKNV